MIFDTQKSNDKRQRLAEMLTLKAHELDTIKLHLDYANRRLALSKDYQAKLDHTYSSRIPENMSIDAPSEL